MRIVVNDAINRFNLYYHIMELLRLLFLWTVAASRLLAVTKLATWLSLGPLRQQYHLETLGGGKLSISTLIKIK